MSTHLKRFLLSAFFLSISHVGYAGSATWNLNPTTNDWNTAENWTPETVPNDYSDVATFDVSTITNIIMSASPLYLGALIFNPGANAYTITSTSYFWLYDAGIVNNSGVTQNIVSPGSIAFFDATTAGDNVFISAMSGGDVNFIGTCDAGSATISLSGSASGLEPVECQFFYSASAANSTIINEAGDVSGASTVFRRTSTAANSNIIAQAGATVYFYENTTAANATLAADGGTITLAERSTGDLSRVELTNGGVLDIDRPHALPTTIGSLEGDSTGSVLLRQSLSIGGNGQSTTFGGVISKPGSLTKTGDETLTLTGANIYGGSTTIKKGTLIVQAPVGSAVSRGPVFVNAGTLGGKGTIAASVTVGAGSGPGAYLSPGTKGPDTLTLTNTLTFKADGIYKCDISLGQSKADQVSANGVTIQSGAQFILQPKGFQTLAVGTVFTVINNTAATPISGTFANLADGTIINATAGNRLQASYAGGDGNDLTLTVVQ